MTLTPVLKKTLRWPSNLTNAMADSTKQPSNEPSLGMLISRYKDTDNASDLLKIVNYFSNCKNSGKLLQCLDEMMKSIPLIDKTLDKVINDFLKHNWYDEVELCRKFHDFIVSLVSAHCSYNFVLYKYLFNILSPDLKSIDKTALIKFNESFTIDKAQQEKYLRVINTIISVHNIIPMSNDNMIMAAVKCRPYYQFHAYCHKIYVHNLLMLTSRLPSLKSSFFEIIVNHIVILDVHSPRSTLQDDQDEDLEEDLFEMEVDKNDHEQKTNCTAHLPTNYPTGDTLDILMCSLLKYIHLVAHNCTVVTWDLSDDSLQCKYSGKIPSDKWKDFGSVTGGCECNGVYHNTSSIKSIYNMVKSVFSKVILSTHRTSHSQFVVFYLLALRPGLVSFFLEFLLEENFKSVSCNRDIRFNAIAYFGSILARAQFIPFVVVHSSLKTLCEWCLMYLENQEKIHTNFFEDIMLHAPFYYACQTIFYVFTFRYEEYTANPKSLTLAKSLGLDHLVLSKLNPLKVCSPAVVTNFASVTRRYQIVYCYTIIENNRRLTIPVASSDGCSSQSSLGLFFPFDPYLLKNSRHFIVHHYKEFKGLPDDGSDEGSVGGRVDSDDEDDFLSNSMVTPGSYDFSYSTSQGYKKSCNVFGE